LIIGAILAMVSVIVYAVGRTAKRS
jgi:hypothetical protein